MSLLLESFMVVAADGLELIIITTVLVALLSVSYYVLFHPLNRERVIKMQATRNVVLFTLIF